MSSISRRDNLILKNDFLPAVEPKTGKERDELLKCILVVGGGWTGLVMFWPNLAKSGTSAENQVLSKYLGGWRLPAG